jgi:hypothetical protein
MRGSTLDCLWECRLTGGRDLIETMERWLGLSPSAVEERQVA